MDGIYDMHTLVEPVRQEPMPINGEVLAVAHLNHPSEAHWGSWCDSPMELAQAYVVPQQMETLFPPEDSLRMGTVFPSLSQPYMGRVR